MNLSLNGTLQMVRQAAGKPRTLLVGAAIAVLASAGPLPVVAATEQVMVPDRQVAYAAPASVAVILGEWTDEINVAAEEIGIPWQVIAAILIIESGGDATLQSPSGAIGLMQIDATLWPEHATRFAATPEELWDPLTNIRTGAAILADAYAKWGTWEQAAAAYIGALSPAGIVSYKMGDDGVTGPQYVEFFRKQLASLSFQISSSTTPVPPAAEHALLIARTTLGVPYVWGGASYEDGGFDCSGLVQWAYAQTGVSLPRTAAEQWAAVTRIAPADVKPGDLVFFYNTYPVPEAGGARIGTTERKVITHVGFYAGNGIMLHAPVEGDVIKMVRLSDPFWRAHLAGYGRVKS